MYLTKSVLLEPGPVSSADIGTNADDEEIMESMHTNKKKMRHINKPIAEYLVK